MKTRKKNFREKGITLIALVVTIIVFLILAGITISMTLNNNGIISKAKTAGVLYTNSANNETEQLDRMSKMLDELDNNNISKIKKEQINNPNVIGSEIQYSGYEGSYTGSWKVFYADDDGVYIITSDVIDIFEMQTDDSGLPTTENGINYGLIN